MNYIDDDEDDTAAWEKACDQAWNALVTYLRVPTWHDASKELPPVDVDVLVVLEREPWSDSKPSMELHIASIAFQYKSGRPIWTESWGGYDVESPSALVTRWTELPEMPE